ncbi:AAA domain-containing protein [Sphaerochaeta associata]|uniref:AAA family ATPase n=1 Tax=Sphaerochaeta associata TaxID=1129264 RepID=A0ABY4DBA8_9SPIR|nr:AAA family ATPase [Sphaerochaeta associata]UOM51097.1 AAA family ATPase [Sphaerochaeta associata]SMP56463.1 AAA domain-containing protein [Sphaerochaeta associata]
MIYANKPCLIVIAGLPGTGKSTISKKLAMELHWPYFDYDTLNASHLKRIEAEYGISDSKLAFYRKWRDTSYETLWAPVIENLNLGIDCILSAPLTREVRDARFFSVLQKDFLERQIYTIGIYLVPDSELHFEMIRSRNSDRDGEIIENWYSYYSNQDTSSPSWDANMKLVLTYRSSDQAFQQALDAIKSRLVE